MHAGRWNDEGEGECRAGLALAFEAVADVEGVWLRGYGVVDIAALAVAGEVGVLSGDHSCAGLENRSNGS